MGRDERVPDASVGCDDVASGGSSKMLKFLLWLLLLVVCWPLAVFALLLWPVVWLLTLPFRLLGVAVEGVFELLRALVLLPARVLGGGPGRA
jgi:hypothetical protein